MKRYGSPKIIVTDGLASYGSALRAMGIKMRQRCGRWLNNRAENSHQPFRRREGAMARFRDIKTLQKFASSHAAVHNHFNLERHLSVICKICTSEPDRSIINPIHQMPGLNT